MKTFIQVIVFLLTISLASSQSRDPGVLEFVESIPVETVLDNPDIRNTEEVWLEMINGAHRSLDIEQFYISPQAGEPLDEILAAIDRAAERGVRVRMIVDSRMYRTYPGTADRYRQIETSGTAKNPVQARVLDFRRLAGGIQHAKFFIVDRKELFMGSQNFDWRALKHIHELGIRLRHAEAVQVYQELFDFDWDVAGDTSANRLSSIPQYQVSPLPLRIIQQEADTLELIPTMSPISVIPDSALWDETNIITLLAAAKEEICLQFLSYAAVGRDKKYYDALDGSIRRMAARGVRVRLLVSDWEKGSPGDSSLKELARIPNIEVKFSCIPDWSGGYVSYARVEHCKFIVVDRKKFWLGTSNGERSYFHTSRNIGMIVMNRLLAERVHEIFMKSWESSYAEAVDPEIQYSPRKHGEE